MADSKDSKALAKAEKKDAQVKIRELNKIAKSHSAAPPLVQVITRPLVAGVTARAMGHLDGRYGDKNPHGLSMVASAVTFLGSIGLAAAGHPTAANVASDACAGAVAGYQYAQGAESGAKAKAEAARPASAG